MEAQPNKEFFNYATTMLFAFAKRSFSAADEIIFRDAVKSAKVMGHRRNRHQFPDVKRSLYEQLSLLGLARWA